MSNHRSLHSFIFSNSTMNHKKSQADGGKFHLCVNTINQNGALATNTFRKICGNSLVSVYVGVHVGIVNPLEAHQNVTQLNGSPMSRNAASVNARDSRDTSNIQSLRHTRAKLPIFMISHGL